MFLLDKKIRKPAILIVAISIMYKYCEYGQ